MNFTAIPTGTSVFLDANVFVYSYVGDPTFGDACTDLRERIELKDLQGFVSAFLLSEIAHRLMTLEACQTLGWSYSGIARQLRRHPAEIKKLQGFRRALDDIVAIGIHILPVHAPDLLLAGDLSLRPGRRTAGTPLHDRFAELERIGHQAVGAPAQVDGIVHRAAGIAMHEQPRLAAAGRAALDLILHEVFARRRKAHRDIESVASPHADGAIGADRGVLGRVVVLGPEPSGVSIRLRFLRLRQRQLGGRFWRAKAEQLLQ